MTLPIIQVGNVLLSPDILTEHFCCDYEKCKGICCVEGDAGAGAEERPPETQVAEGYTSVSLRQLQ